MSQGVVSSPENLPGNKAYSDLLSWPHTIVSNYISSQPLSQSNVTLSKNRKTSIRKIVLGMTWAEMNSVGYFIGDWAWLSSANLWSNTDVSEALMESHLWIWGLLSSSPLYQDSSWNLLAPVLYYFSGISFWLCWYSTRTVVFNILFIIIIITFFKQ